MGIQLITDKALAAQLCAAGLLCIEYNKPDGWTHPMDMKCTAFDLKWLWDTAETDWDLGYAGTKFYIVIEE